MKIRFMKDAVVDELKRNISKNCSKYGQSDNSWVQNEWLKEFKHELPEFSLDLLKEKPEDTDFNNIKILYSNLKTITDSQACDERLWAGLCHDKFWNYMQYRWSISKVKETKEDSILNHYFFKQTGQRALMTNALARLWWVGRLTYDKNAEDPFILTEYLCKDLNGRGFPLFGSNFSNNKEVTKNFLYILMKYEEKNKLNREEFLEVIKRMNLWGGKIILDSLSKEELSRKILEFLKGSKNLIENE